MIRSSKHCALVLTFLVGFYNQTQAITSKKADFFSSLIVTAAIGGNAALINSDAPVGAKWLIGGASTLLTGFSIAGLYEATPKKRIKNVKKLIDQIHLDSTTIQLINRLHDYIEPAGQALLEGEPLAHIFRYKEKPFVAGAQYTGSLLYKCNKAYMLLERALDDIPSESELVQQDFKAVRSQLKTLIEQLQQLTNYFNRLERRRVAREKVVHAYRLSKVIIDDLIGQQLIAAIDDVASEHMHDVVLDLFGNQRFPLLGAVDYMQKLIIACENVQQLLKEAAYEHVLPTDNFFSNNYQSYMISQLIIEALERYSQLKRVVVIIKKMPVYVQERQSKDLLDLERAKVAAQQAAARAQQEQARAAQRTARAQEAKACAAKQSADAARSQARSARRQARAAEDQAGTQRTLLTEIVDIFA